MKVLIVNKNFHHKNKIGFEKIFKYLKYEYKYGNINDIKDYDIIYSPNDPIDTSKYPNKKFIFGPHFSVFPNNRLLNINNIHKNSIYIQPSKWVVELWKKSKFENVIEIKKFPFPVEVDKFKPLENINKTEVFIMFKNRNPKELEYIINYLNKLNVKYHIFDYTKKYNETDYLRCLHNSKYGIWIGCHESQGFALEEALSCNVPLLVWNVKYMSQEYRSNYPNIPATTISYWDERCGKYFYEEKDFDKTYNTFIKNLDNYKPREFILENISVKKCSENLKVLINSFE